MEVAIQKIQKQTTKTQEQLIMRIYKQAFEQSWSEYMDIIGRGKIPPNGFLDKTKLAYINQLYTQLQTQSAICNENIPKRILNEYAEIAKKISNNAEFNKMIDKSVNIVSKDIVSQMIQGQVYKDGKGLDSRLWSSVNVAGQKIEDAITSCLARGIGSAEASKIITQFANTGHHTWDRKKIREKLGDGYASKYGTGGLDYEALRLMRTTTTHMAQLSAINSHKVNPYSNYVIYHIGHAGARTCSLCRDRDGKKYKLEEVPLDHPNGLCWLEPFMSLDGKSPATLADLMDDMNDYYDGKPNSGIMEKWTKEYGVAPVKPQQAKKPTVNPPQEKKPEKKPTEKPPQQTKVKVRPWQQKKPTTTQQQKPAGTTQQKRVKVNPLRPKKPTGTGTGTAQQKKVKVNPLQQKKTTVKPTPKPTATKPAPKTTTKPTPKTTPKPKTTTPKPTPKPAAKPTTKTTTKPQQKIRPTAPTQQKKTTVKTQQEKTPTAKTQQQKSTKVQKGHLYTEEQREAKYKELETKLREGISNVLDEELDSNDKNREKLTQSAVKGIIGNLQKYPAPIQDLYLYTGKDLKMKYTDGGAFYRPSEKAIFISVKAVSRDMRGAYGTVFHEWGHLIDNQLQKGKIITRERKKEMYKILNQDLENQIQNHVTKSNVSKQEARKMLKRELSTAPHAIAGVSDIYGGLTGNQVSGRWTHKKTYWTKVDKTASVCSEAWSDILQSYGIPRQASYIEKYLPGGKAYVEKTVEELIEKIKKK